MQQIELITTIPKTKTKLYEVKNLSKVSSRTLMSLDGVDDMICMSDLTEGSLLWNLKTRYERNQIYVNENDIYIPS